MRAKKSMHAFTLLEMLVVLLIVGMATTMLFQMLSQTIRMQRNAGLEIAGAQQDTMQTDWLRQLVNGLQPDYQDGKYVFKGGARLLTGLSNNPLTIDYGAPMPVALALEYDADNDLTRLYYGRAASQALDKSADKTILMYWPHDIGRLLYVDAAGDTHDAWPPPSGLWPQLPQAVRLEFDNERGPQVIVATPDGPAEPAPRVRDLTGAAVMQ